MLQESVLFFYGELVPMISRVFFPFGFRKLEVDSLNIFSGGLYRLYRASVVGDLGRPRLSRLTKYSGNAGGQSRLVSLHDPWLARPLSGKITKHRGPKRQCLLWFTGCTNEFCRLCFSVIATLCFEIFTWNFLQKFFRALSNNNIKTMFQTHSFKLNIAS